MTANKDEELGGLSALSDRSAKNRPELSRRSSISSITGRWRSLGSRRLIKYVSSTSDIGYQDNRKGMVATPISEETSKAMRMLRRSSNIEDEENRGATRKLNDDKPMYRLQLTRQNELGHFSRAFACMVSCLNCGAHTGDSTGQILFLGLGSPNRWLVDFFYWLFRKGWLTIFFWAVIIFYILVALFSALIIFAAVIDSDCIRIGDEQFGSSDTRSLAANAFALSWHTFSTVGFGSTNPALSTQHNHTNDARCAFINFICPLEALVGVIFGAFTGAVIFAKVTRVSQRAPVRFCQPLLIKVDKDGTHDNIGSPINHSSPFPILEFRLANEWHSQPGGEIIDANVSVVVLQESSNNEFEVGVDMAKKISMNRLRRGKAIDDRSTDTATYREGSFGSTISSEVSRTTRYSSVTDTAKAYLSLSPRKKRQTTKTIKVDAETESSSGIVSRMIFSKLSLDNSEHPMFKRVWSFRHVMNEDSPLLTKEARQEIILNGGCWKHAWNSAEHIRKAIHFNELIISFTGVSKLSNFSVYSQKAYDTSNLIIGYEFANMLYHSRRGALTVDLSLLNDVIEQTSGENFDV